MGKTAWGLNVAEYMAIDNARPVVFFSMEMSKQQLAQRVLCSRGKVDSHKLRRGMLDAGEIEALKAACDEVQHAPLLVDDTPGMSVLELRSKARRLRSQHGIEAVFVDYLQLMHSPGANSREQEVSSISRGLKALARELEIPVIAMAQLNRQPEGREGHRPRMGDLRESGAIEQDADVILLLHRESYYKPDDPDLKGKAEVIIAKQRNGPTGTLTLTFREKLTRFENFAFDREGVSSAVPF
jgi:replicative DNA helicase